MVRALAILSLAISAFGCSDNATSTTDHPLSADGGARDLSVGDLELPTDANVSADLEVAPDMSGWSGPPFLLLGGESGLNGPIIDANPDEGGNLWAVAPDALYILRAGEKMFRRYTNADGLHIYSVITAVAGGGQSDGFVGLEGYVSDTPDTDSDEQKHVGKAEHVHLQVDGTITSLHYADMHNDNDNGHWETRSARRLLYSHDGPTAGHLFMGANHGVTHILNDGWGDHIHVEVWWMPENIERLGEWYGLAIDPKTNGLWTCGRFGCGLQNYLADPMAWVTNGKYLYAFTTFADGHPLNVASGYEEDDAAVAVTPDETVWILSKKFGLAKWHVNQQWDYSTITEVTVPGLGFPVDMVADTDGTLWFADPGQVLHYNPQDGSATPLANVPNDVRRLYLDLRSSPRGLYISTGAGIAIYHGP
jgi:hypothetical protein